MLSVRPGKEICYQARALAAGSPVRAPRFAGASSSAGLQWTETKAEAPHRLGCHSLTRQGADHLRPYDVTRDELALGNATTKRLPRSRAERGVCAEHVE